MVDLRNQYKKIKNDIDSAILNVVDKTNFINGDEVTDFTNNLSIYLDEVFVIPCANGTDALQIAMMALDLKPGDEIIVPSFTYVATAEVIALLNLTPVLVDVDLHTFNISVNEIEKAISPKTKAIVPVHLFGQCAEMESILSIAQKYNLYVIEDTAQALGSNYLFSDGKKSKAGTMGHIGCTSFFPTKNLGCYGDGGAIFTKDSQLAQKIKMICNHGQVKKYIHKIVGVNSRLDTIQASVLNIKLKHLEKYNEARLSSANLYDDLLKNQQNIEIPFRSKSSSHVFHQYTLIVKNNKRDQLKSYLESFGIPSMIYYPIPLNNQEAYNKICKVIGRIDNTNYLCASVLSLPMHTELTREDQIFITDKIISFIN